MVEHTRTLDFKVAFAIGLGTMIAAGIFSLSGTAVAAIGSTAVLAFVIAALIAGVTAATYSEFASIYSENGGGYLFSSKTFEHDRLTYAIGALLFLGYTGTTAFYLATMDEWLFRFVLPESLHFLPHGTTGVATALLLGALNARGTEESGTFQLLVTGAKVAVLLAFVAGMFVAVGPASASSTFVSRFGGGPVDVITISALAFITFFGFSAIAASAGEIIEPRKTVPLAIAASMITVTVLYALVIVAMVNSPVPAEVIAQEGETAMGRVAAGFLGPAGRGLIVAGAVFSMVSASNASILAASGIGSLMGHRGQAPRRFSRIHPGFGTPIWAIAAATGVIVVEIAAFIGVFPAEGGLAGLNLGLTALTGFATLNLLIPLSVVNVALVYSRRRLPDVERGFRVPGVPVLPAIGVLANLGLIASLPPDGVVVGLVVNAVVIGAYLAWGGTTGVEDLVEEVVPARGPAEATGGTGAGGGEGPAGDRFRILVPVARPSLAVPYVRLAETIGEESDDPTFVQVLNVTQIPDQTPNEVVRDTAEARADRIEGYLAEADVDVEYAVEGHVSRDVAFGVLQTAREDGADRILMGYPHEHRNLAETVEYEAPCPVYFASGVDEMEAIETVTVGAGGGPHHAAMLPLIDRLGRRGVEVHVVNVDPAGGGTPEDVEETLSALSVEPEVHSLSAPSVAEGLVSSAAENGGPLFIGATRNRRLRRWVLGSTPDRVIDFARDAGVPVLVFASPGGVSGRVEDYLFPVYRYARKLLRERRSGGRAPPGEATAAGVATSEAASTEVASGETRPDESER